MATTEAATGMIDIREFAERVPESAMLAKMGHLATTEGKSGYSEWWEDLRAEYAAGVLPVDAAVAAYFAVIRPVDPRRAKETDGPENARALKSGVKVAAELNGGFNIDESGVLAADAEALLGHPQPPHWEGYASIRLGLRFQDRKDVVRLFPANRLYIGDEQIADAYEDLVVEGDEPRRRVASKYGHVALTSLRSTAVMQKLGLLEGNDRFEPFKNSLVSSSVVAMQPERLRPGQTNVVSHNLRMARIMEALPYLHALDSGAGEELIQAYAGDERLFDYESVLVRALAATRSPYALDSVSDLERKMWEHRAAAEIYETRLSLLGEN